MRITYYQFPDTVDAMSRYKNGARQTEAYCQRDRDTCRECPYHEGGYSTCEYFFVTEAEDTISCSVSYAKTMLKKFGGVAWTDHCERDGGVFETTPVTLKGNNSEFHYNRHL